MKYLPSLVSAQVATTMVVAQVGPTAVPAVPTAVPTAVPAVPTAEPTGVPNGQPTSTTTAVPTAVPTAEPTAASAEPYPRLSLVSGTGNITVDNVTVLMTEEWAYGEGTVTLNNVTYQSAPQGYTYNNTLEQASFSITTDQAGVAPLSVILKCDPDAYVQPLKVNSVNVGPNATLEASTWTACKNSIVFDNNGTTTLENGQGECFAGHADNFVKSAKATCDTSMMHRCFFVADFHAAPTCDFQNISLAPVMATEVCGSCHRLEDESGNVYSYLKKDCKEEEGFTVEFSKCSDSACTKDCVVQEVTGSSVVEGGNTDAYGGSCTSIPGPAENTSHSFYLGAYAQDCAAYTVEVYLDEDNCTGNSSGEHHHASGERIILPYFDNVTQKPTLWFLTATCVDEPGKPVKTQSDEDSVVVRTSTDKWCANDQADTHAAGQCFQHYDPITMSQGGRKVSCNEFGDDDGDEDDIDVDKTMCANFDMYDGYYNDTACPWFSGNLSVQWAAACNTCNKYGFESSDYYEVVCHFDSNTVDFRYDCDGGCSNCSKQLTTNQTICSTFEENSTQSLYFKHFFTCNTVTVTEYVNPTCEGASFQHTTATGRCNGRSEYECVPKSEKELVTYRTRSCDANCTGPECNSASLTAGMCNHNGATNMTEHVMCDSVKEGLCVAAQDETPEQRHHSFTCDNCHVHGNMSVKWFCDATHQTARLMNYTDTECKEGETLVEDLDVTNPDFTFELRHDPRQPDHHPNMSSINVTFGGITACQMAQLKLYASSNCDGTLVYDGHIPMGSCHHSWSLTCSNILDKPLMNTIPDTISTVTYAEEMCAGDATNTTKEIHNSCQADTDADHDHDHDHDGEFRKLQCYNKGYCFTHKLFSTADECAADTPREVHPHVCDVCYVDYQGKMSKYACDIFGEKIHRMTDCDEGCGNCAMNESMSLFKCGEDLKNSSWYDMVSEIYPCDSVVETEFDDKDCTGNGTVRHAYPAGACMDGQRTYCADVQFTGNTNVTPSTDGSSASGMSTAAKAFIGIGIVALIVVLGVVGFIMYSKKQQGTGQRADDANAYELMGNTQGEVQQ